MQSSKPLILSHHDSMIDEFVDMISYSKTNSLSLERISVELIKNNNNNNNDMDDLCLYLPIEDKSLDISKTSQISLHSSVIDSVFSTTIGEDELIQDHTPMFDELEFIDETKANVKDDWVSLFGAENDLTDTNEKINDIKQEDLSDNSLNLLKFDNEKRLYNSVERSLEFVSLKNENDNTQIFSDKIQNQLVTPNPSSVLPTPFINSERFINSKLNNKFSPKIDHLGCITYSRKKDSEPLAPIKVDSNDPVVLKRARNTEAARRSRARKMEKMFQLETKVKDLTKEKLNLENEISKLKELLINNGIQF